MSEVSKAETQRAVLLKVQHTQGLSEELVRTQTPGLHYQILCFKKLDTKIDADSGSAVTF